MTTRIYDSLIGKRQSSKDTTYLVSLNDLNRRLRLEVYDKCNSPKAYDAKRMTPQRLEEMAKETFTDINFICGVCADSGVNIIFKPTSTDEASQKYFGHNICINENSALTIILQTGKDSKTLPAVQRKNYITYIDKVIEEYLSKGIDIKKYTKQKLEPILVDNIQQFDS